VVFTGVSAVFVYKTQREIAQMREQLEEVRGELIYKENG
jgi:hypothetical protein